LLSWCFYDPPKEGVTQVIRELNSLGITVKVITGDNSAVASSVGRSVLGFEPQLLTGKELHS
jgi:Mg2+-importing ATPase